MYHEGMDKFTKLKLSLRYWLLGKEFFAAADALEFASYYHTGVRKDGVTPELQHQVEIAHYLRTLLPSLMFPEATLTAALLHDVTEDYDVNIAAIENKYGSQVAGAVKLLDKNGKMTGAYFNDLGQCPIASLVKGADRIHNLQSMHDVFTPEKQFRYIREVEDSFLPMLKIARRAFVQQEAAYENIKHMLESQMQLIRVTRDGDLADDQNKGE